MEISFTDIERQVANAAIYALIESASITSESRRDAVTLILAYVRKHKKTSLEVDEFHRLVGNAYDYFEYGKSLLPELQECFG